ncbi:MAG: O-antigen ligase family protein [Chloroflexota bacterium]|nr:O-antigen ligase family protein [Chloroflexota bacterium]
MSLKTAVNQPERRSVFWPWRGSLIESMLLPIHLWEQMALLLVFGLLLIVVVAACTGYLSLAIAGGLIVGLAAMVFLVLRPQFALLLVFLGAGLPSLLIPLPGHTMRPIELTLILCFMIVILRRPTMRPRFPHLLALLFLAIALISFLHVPAIARGLDSYGADKRLFALVLLLLAFFCGTFLIRYASNVSSLLCVALLLNLPFLLIGMAQALHIPLPALLVPSQALEVIQQGRLSGPTDSPTTFAFYLINLLAVALVCWTLGIRRWHRWTGTVMTIVIALELIGSGTRSATAAAVLMVIVALLITRRFKWLLALTFLAIPLIVVSLNTILPKFLHDSTSITNRLFLWQVALKLIAANPWIGIGMEQFPTYYAKLIVSQAAVLNPAGISVHNQYLELALESGIFWLIIGLLLLFSMLFSCWKAYKFAERQQRMLLLATILMILPYLVISFVDVPLDKPEGVVFLFFVGGLALGCVEHIRKSRELAPTKSVARVFPAQSILAIKSRGSAPGYFKSDRPTGSLALRLPMSDMQATRAADEPYAPLPGQLQGGGMLPLQLTAPLPVIIPALPSEELQSASKTGQAVIIQIIFWAVAIPVTFPTTALMTRYLGPLQYGEYSFTLPILAICALCTMTGMDSWLIRHLSRQKRSQWGETLGYAAGARLLTSLLVAGGAFIVICFLPLGIDQRNLLLLGVGTLVFSFSFNCLRGMYECGFVAAQQVSGISLLTTVNRITTAGLIVLAVLLHLSLIWTYVLITYSDLPFFCILVLLARRHFQMRLRFSFARTWSMLRESLPFTGYDALALFGGQVDVLLLLPLAGALSVGIYALALRITNPLLSIAFAYVGGLYPFLCAKFEKGTREFAWLYHEATRILALGIVPLTLFVVVEAPAIISLLAGDRFAAAALPTQFLMGSIALVFFSQLALRACMAANKERKIPVISAATLVITILANALLIPRWQATGASIAALLAELISVCSFSMLLARQVSLWKTLRMLLLVLLGNLPGLGFLLWQSQMPLLILAAIFGLLSLLGCIATRTLSFKDVHMARQILILRRRA